MLVKPRPGFAVRDPRTKTLITEAGVEAPEGDLDFARLLADGDLVPVETDAIDEHDDEHLPLREAAELSAEPTHDEEAP